MDLSARLQQLEQLVLEAKSMPLSSSVLVSRDELLQMISEMQESIPEEIKQARWIVKDREDLLGKARAAARRAPPPIRRSRATTNGRSRRSCTTSTARRMRWGGSDAYRCRCP